MGLLFAKLWSLFCNQGERMQLRHGPGARRSVCRRGDRRPGCRRTDVLGRGEVTSGAGRRSVFRLGGGAAETWCGGTWGVRKGGVRCPGIQTRFVGISDAERETPTGTWRHVGWVPFMFAIRHPKSCPRMSVCPETDGLFFFFLN